MPSINLSKILLKGEVLSLLRGLITTHTSPITIQDQKGKVLVADLGIEVNKSSQAEFNHAYDYPSNVTKVPILLDEEVLGWVIGNEQTKQVADFLNYIVKREFERKTLAADALDKYREISLLYTIASKMSSCLDVKEIGTLVIEEASRLIRCTSASVMLHNQHDNSLEIIAAKGTAERIGSLKFAVDKGIAGYVFTTGKPELVNDATKDPRYIIVNENHSYALICAPILTKDRSLGVVNISNSEPISYTSQDLKLFTALVTQASGAIENALLHESKLQEERIKNNLERYLSPQVAQAVINDAGEVSLTTSKRRIAMLFSDIRNFTTKCEELEPEQLVAYLNEYFTQMVDVIFTNQGTVNKFVGDMIVAMFGAPSAIADREYWAIAAAINMQKRIKELPIDWIRENFITGIGISSGDVIVGNIGSPQHMDYTAIGDEMNIASRLQGLAQGGQILVTRSVYEATQSSFQFREFGTLPVKGKKNLVEIFEVIY
ncbi:adenylate/guanylate cyclase domain-containing protein [Pseudanabaena yagii]|uniref:GAF domain-containing protein n=1 Tax=Pseudanabaena yagii GIHE-NHR1 TaxID=2722753 RepID=A0ABX1LXH0_9CYAN|nr:adenylate/guanylate cyclase domain-containing protein [Pseudanabaena yagii]NMF60905.1 GAF domain-containing protein [Pseudanabaena yagii GIHE-NHR1]